MSRWPFSNFRALSTPMLYGGELYPTVEHFYQAMKAPPGPMRERIRKLETCAAAKRLARDIPWQPKFDRLAVMEFALRYKFSLAPERKMLLEHQPPIVEYNTWHDNFWGDCTCEDCKDTPGENQLGKLLMLIRLEALLG